MQETKQVQRIIAVDISSENASERKDTAKKQEQFYRLKKRLKRNTTAKQIL